MTEARRLTPFELERITSQSEMPPDEYARMEHMLQRLAIDVLRRVSSWGFDNPIGFVKADGPRWLIQLIDAAMQPNVVSREDHAKGVAPYDRLTERVEACLPDVLGDEQVLALDSLACLLDMRLAEATDYVDDRLDTLTEEMKTMLSAFRVEAATDDALDRLAKAVPGTTKRRTK